MGRHVSWRAAVLAVAVSAAGCGGGTNLEGDAPDARGDVDGSEGDDGLPGEDVGDDGEADAAADTDACVPACEDAGCGDDGCGGLCPCGEREVCVVARGECVAGRGWVEVPPNWPPAPGNGMVYDSVRRVVVMLAVDSPAGPSAASTWEFDGTAWRRIETPTSPPAVSGQAMTYDSARGVVVLFTLDPGAGAREGETWEYDGASWAKVSTLISPSNRASTAMTYDSVRRVVVLFGGSSGGENLGDTWEYDGSNWRAVVPPTSPLPRSGHSMAYDSARGVVVLFGGLGEGGYLLETWQYDGATWTNVGIPPIDGLWSSPMVYDSARGVVVLWTGLHVWEYDGTGWARVVAPASPDVGSGLLAYDSTRAIVVLWTGTETWDYDGTSWTEVERTKPRGGLSRVTGPGEASSADYADSATTYDSARDAVVLFQGWGDRSVEVGTTWEFDGISWTAVWPTTSPLTRYGSAMAFDSSRGVVVLFGGSRVVGYGGEETADTWEFDGTTWTDVSPSVSPPARFGHAMAYDSARGVVVLFGGRVSGVGNLADTWEFDGTTWTDVSPPVSPSARVHHAMAYVSARGVVVLFGGGGAGCYACSPYPCCSTTTADTWEFDGTSWTEVVSPTAPHDHGAHALAYDSARGVVVLFGGMHLVLYGHHSYPELAGTETWEYDGTAWTEYITPIAPPAQVGHAMAYDSARGAVLLFGSYGPDGSPSPTWEYYGP